MPEVLFPRNARIKGLSPALDPRQLEDPFVIDGRNFLVDAEGPYSTFGAELFSINKLMDFKYLGSFEVGNCIIFLTKGVAFIFDDGADLFVPQFTFPDTSDFFPWSYATVGAKHYFCTKGAGVIEYDEVINQWQLISANIPAGPVAITESNGRLVVLGTEFVAWSAIADGTDFVDSLVTGAGRQLVAEHTGGGDPLGVYQTGDGFITFTSRGIMKSSVIDVDITFRHLSLTREFVPISQYAIVDIQESGGIVFLAKQGLYQTRGDIPQVFQPLMSEFFRLKVMNVLDTTNPTLIRLNHAEKQQWFIVSVAENEQQFVYSRAYILYMPIDEWGSFDRVHSGMGQYDCPKAEAAVLYGYVDQLGNLFEFNDSASVDLVPDISTGDHFIAEIDMPSTYEKVGSTVTLIASSMLLLDTYRPELYTEGSGFYTNDRGRDFKNPATASNVQENSSFGTPNVGEIDAEMAGGVTLVEPVLLVYDKLPLGSYVTVGPYRLTENKNPTEFSILSALATHTGLIAIGGDLEDWLNFEPETFEDWLVLVASEDWGSGVAGNENFDIEMQGTLDGKTVWEQQTEVPTLITGSGGTKHYGVYNAGVYHLVKMSALEDLQNFHLKLLELSGSIGGRL